MAHQECTVVRPISVEPPDKSIRTPPGKPKGVAGLLTSRRLTYWAARIGAALAKAQGRPLRLGSTVIAARHVDVTEALSRDLDFRIQPILSPKFDPIGFHFILGMDRSAGLIAERRVLYAALARVDDEALRADASQDIADRLASVGNGPLDLIEGYARPVAAATAGRLFGIDPDNRAAFMDAARAVFGNSFLNPSGDQGMVDRAYAGANLLSGWFEEEIARRRAAQAFGTDMMSALLASGAGDDLIRRTLGGMLVGSIDTTATCVAKVLVVLMDDADLLRRVSANTDDPVRMLGWCNEALRRWPHGPLLVRKAACDTTLGGTTVKVGDTIFLWTQAAMLDASAFAAPLDLRPDRSDAAYLHFGGGLHPCAGRGVNAWQIPMLVSRLLEKTPVRLGQISWAGPFPANLPIEFAGTQA